MRLRNAIYLLFCHLTDTFHYDFYTGFFSNFLCTVIVIEQNTNVNVPGNSKNDLSLSPLLKGPFL